MYFDYQSNFFNKNTLLYIMQTRPTQIENNVFSFKNRILYIFIV